MNALARRARDEAGSITPFVVIVALGILMLAGLVVDGGRQLNAKGRAIAYAQEAARAGSQAVDVTDPKLDLDPTLALRAARAYCQQAMAKDSHLVRCEPRMTTVNDAAGTFRAVQVTATVDIKAILLGIMGKHTLVSSGGALARPVTGISEADGGKVSDLAPPSVVPPGDEDPGVLQPPEVTVTPCAPMPPSPTPTPTPKDTGKPGKPGQPGKPKPSPTPTPEKWPPDPPPGKIWCVTPSA